MVPIMAFTEPSKPNQVKKEDDYDTHCRTEKYTPNILQIFHVSLRLIICPLHLHHTKDNQ